MKVEAVRDKLRSLGARVCVKRRQFRHREKTYLHITMACSRHVWLQSVQPAITEHFPDAYITSGVFGLDGVFGPEMNVVVSLEK